MTISLKYPVENDQIVKTVGQKWRTVQIGRSKMSSSRNAGQKMTIESRGSVKRDQTIEKCWPKRPNGEDEPVENDHWVKKIGQNWHIL